MTGNWYNNPYTGGAMWNAPLYNYGLSRENLRRAEKTGNPGALNTYGQPIGTLAPLGGVMGGPNTGGAMGGHLTRPGFNRSARKAPPGSVYQRGSVGKTYYRPTRLHGDKYATEMNQKYKQKKNNNRAQGLGEQTSMVGGLASFRI